MVFDAPLYDSAWQEKLPAAGVYGGLFRDNGELAQCVFHCCNGEELRGL